jgi:hypothetical protein
LISYVDPEVSLEDDDDDDDDEEDDDEESFFLQCLCLCLGLSLVKHSNWESESGRGWHF